METQRPFPRSASAVLVASLLAACGGSSAEPVTPTTTDCFTGSCAFTLNDPHNGGLATEVRWTDLAYGRLVELFGRDAEGRRVLMGSDFVVGQGIESQAGVYTLERNAITGQELLTIERNVEDAAGRADFLDLARAAATALDTIQVRDLGTSGVVSMLPRNAALVLSFDDLLDPGSIDGRTVQLRTGAPPVQPFEARVFPSAFWGGHAGGAFYPTRVVIDLTTSELDVRRSAVPLPINGVGAPASSSAGVANAQVRIATRLAQSIGITRVLTNLTGHTLATGTNGPVDFADATRPVTRAFRTGGRAGLVDDPFNGFLEDDDAPVLVGATPVELLDAPVQLGGGVEYLLPRVRFLSSSCASRPEVGDVLVQGEVIAEIDETGAALDDGVARDVRVRLLVVPGSWGGPGDWAVVGAGAATYETAFDSFEDSIRPACFVGVTPRPAGFPGEPTVGVGTDAIFSLRFSEPMDPASLTAFDSVTLTRTPFDADVPTATSDFVVGQVSQTADLTGLSFVPRELLSHVNGEAESYFMRITGGDDELPPRDLAGNPLRRVPEVRVSIDADELTVQNGGRVNRFTSLDEEAPEGPEFAGQVVIDSVRQVLRSRPVVRSSVVVDGSQPMVQQMNYVSGGRGLITPFTPFGSKAQVMWRYADCGFSLLDPLDHNIDIEGLSWAPSAGAVQPDAFSRFEIRLAHSRWAPDEDLNPFVLPRFPASGIKVTFANNVLASAPADVPAQTVVHDRSRGYTIDPGNLYTSSTGTTLIPFPLNQDLPFDERRYFTWRDGANRARTGHLNGMADVDPRAYWAALGIPVPAIPVFEGPEIQTIGLPLLMEFRVLPDSNAIGINGWDYYIALNNSPRPTFRAFSSGGTNQSGGIETVDPDAESTAAGGFTPGSTPPGAPTPGLDNVVHIGAIDYITRVSHAHSVWFSPDIAGEDPTGPFPGRVYGEPTVEPDFDEQPAGTELQVRYRGATSITYLDTGTIGQDNDGGELNPGGLTDFQVDAFTLDVYGDYYNDAEFTPVHSRGFMNPGVSFVGGDDFWRDSVDEIRDARFYQVRLTFIGNPENGETAEVSAFAMTWSRP